MLKPFLFCIAVALASAEDVRQGEVARNSTNVDEVFVGGRLRGMSDKMESDAERKLLAHNPFQGERGSASHGTLADEPSHAAAVAASCPTTGPSCNLEGGPPPLPLLDPCAQSLFAVEVPNALDPSFAHTKTGNKFNIDICEGLHQAGITGDSPCGPELFTPIYGYRDNMSGGSSCTWPGKTIHAHSDDPTQVRWRNQLKKNKDYILTSLTGEQVIDTSLHWAYSLPGYETYTADKDGTPVVPHVHGGHSDFQFDGNPEFFYSPNFKIVGPEWDNPKIAASSGNPPVHEYDNSQQAAMLWYHDHALGITRLNAYAGMAGFFVVRDDLDTGLAGNDLTLPAFPYETALAIQDKMFKTNGELFYPSFPGDPAYNDFIDEDVDLPDKQFPNGGPSALAEFFGDFMVVNGKIWPKMQVEPRHYRLRLLNGCDSRFLAIYFCDAGLAADHPEDCEARIPFTVVGSDQGLAFAAQQKDTLLIEPGGRYDIIFDFGDVDEQTDAYLYEGKRIIVKNIGGDEPFGGDIPGPQVFDRTDRIIAFDVTLALNSQVTDDFDVGTFNAVVGNAYENGGPGGYYTRVPDDPTVPTRRVALFEGRDEYGRLQPLLGTVDPATDDWPDDAAHDAAGLVGPMQGTMAWHEPTTEKPTLGSTEMWEIWNLSGDAHPIHLHLVHFEVVGRNEIVWDSNSDDGILPGGMDPAEDGTYLMEQPLVQHNGEIGTGFKVVNPEEGDPVVFNPDSPYFEGAPKDVVTALPGQVTRIKAKFDKPGRYVWHCHILSHEDHEMMRILEVV